MPHVTTLQFLKKSNIVDYIIYMMCTNYYIEDPFSTHLQP
jgi:hypothetical protein